MGIAQKAQFLFWSIIIIILILNKEYNNKHMNQTSEII